MSSLVFCLEEISPDALKMRYWRSATLRKQIKKQVRDLPVLQARDEGLYQLTGNQKTITCRKSLKGDKSVDHGDILDLTSRLSPRFLSLMPGNLT